MEESKAPTLMQFQFCLPKKIAITTVVMFSLIWIVYHFGIPNPNMILIAGLVLCCALFGFGGGILASVIMQRRRQDSGRKRSSYFGNIRKRLQLPLWRG